MATTVNKQKIVTVLFSKVKKVVSQEQQELPVMEQVIYPICREGSSKEQADEVYQKLKLNPFFIWQPRTTKKNSNNNYIIGVDFEFNF